jgi:nucleoside-diphosphate kinase
MAIEQTLVLIKPDGLKKSLTGNILTVFSETKFKIVGAKMVKVSKELAEAHYVTLREKPYYPASIDYIMGKLHGENRVMALVYEGENAVKAIKTLCGATNPEEADPLTIRGKYGRIRKGDIYENVVHASGNVEEAEYEVKLWFRPGELTHAVFPAETMKTTREELVWKGSHQSVL